MKKIILTSLALFSTGIGLFAEPSAESMNEAEKLVDLMGFKDQMASGFTAMLPIIEQQAAQMNLSAEDATELKSIYKDWFTNDLDHAAIQQKVVVLYAETFTEEELTGLFDFYQTPLGKKTLKALPELMEKASRLGMEEAQLKQSALLTKLKPFIEKQQAK